MGTDLIPPKPIRLELSQFPAAAWAIALVGAINQFAQQVVSAFKIATPTFREISFKTSATVEDSFPINVPVDTLPSEVRIAAIPSGDSGFSAVTLKWQPVSNNGSSRCIQVNFITGLNADTAYTVRLAYL